MTTWEEGMAMRQMQHRVTEQDKELERLRAEVQAWRAQVAKLPVRGDVDFTTISGLGLETAYAASDLRAGHLSREGMPGEFPYTRGIHPTMYRGRLWTMRQFAGFGTAQDTNAPLQVSARPRARPACRSPSIFPR